METFGCNTLFRFCAALLALTMVAALQWSATPKDGEVLYPCTDQDVTLAWDYTLDDGEVVTYIEWNFEGLSHEMVAMSAHGNFLTTPAFSHRIMFLPDAGLVLHHVTKGDTGNYSITVRGQHSSGVSFTMSRRVLVQVADALMTEDHELLVRQEPQAVFSNNTDQWHVALDCGHFTVSGNPPVTVEWVTPEGQTLLSTLYADGYYTLLLANPVLDGTYTCRISDSSLNASCTHGVSQKAGVHVNAMLARMTLMEGEQSRLREELVRKDAELETLRAEFTNQSAEVETMRAEFTNQSAEVANDMSRVKTEVRNMASCCGPCNPDKYTVIRDTWRLTSEGDGSQCDSQLQPGWYRFMVNGSNAVIPTTCVQKNHCQTDAPQWVDLQGKPLPGVNQEVLARTCAHWDSSCCNLEFPITVRNCGHYFVYKLQPTSSCSYAYCVELQ